MATLLPEGKQSFTNSAGSPLVGGKVYTYNAGTNTPRATYQDAAGTVPNTNPVVLDARGEATIFWAGSYKVVLKDTSDVTIWTVDNVADAADASYEITALLAGSTGAGLIGFQPSGVGATATTVQKYLRDRQADMVNIKDAPFYAKGDGVTDDTAAIQSAINYAISVNKSIWSPSGTYIAHGLTYSSGSSHCAIAGAGSGTTIWKNNVDTNPVLTITGNPNQMVVSGINFSGNGTVTSWGNGNGVGGNSLVGTIPTSTAALTAVNLVHATFIDCYFTNAIFGADVRGGIGITFISCFAYWNASVGFRIYKSTTAPLSGWPNNIALRDCNAKENGQAGVYFDDGRLLVIDGGDYEGNGKNTVQATYIGCGVYIGSNTGSENGATAGPNGTPFHSLAASISNAWFEQNGNNTGAGVPSSTNMAHIVHKHGFLKVEGCNFTNPSGGRVLRIEGGQYQIENCSFEGALTVAANQIDEGATSGNANLVENNFINNCYGNATGLSPKLTAAYCTVDPSKTFFDFARYTPVKTRYGSGTTSGGVLVVTWPAGTWLTVPVIQAQVFTNDGGTTTYSAETFGVSTAGASIRAKQNAAGTVTQPAITVTWIAVGS